jgi:hypothetical protein
VDEILKRLVVQITYQVDEGSRGKVDQDQTRTQAKAVAIGQIAASAITKAAEIGVAVVRALGDAVVDAVQGFAEMGGEIADTSAKLGIGTDELQRLRHAAKLSGVDVGQVAAGIRELGKGLTEARTKGTGPFVEGLGLVGVELRELEGLSQRQQLGLLGDAIGGITDPAERTAAALKLFGGSGSELLPLLLQGSAGIDALSRKADELGLVLDSKTIGQAEALGDTLDVLESQAKVAAARVGSYLAPIVTDAAERMGAWAAENRGFIEQDLPAAISAIVSAGGSVLAWLADVITEFRQFGREVGFAYDRAVELATTLREDLQPAIEVGTAVVEAYATIWGTITSAIGDAIASVLDYIGVLDTLKAAWEALPFTGESIDDLTARLHGGGASDFYKRNFGSKPGEAAPGPAPGAGRREKDDQVAALATATAEITTWLKESNAEAAKTDPRKGARDRYRAGLRKPKGGGGGGGKSDGPSAADTLDKIWGSLTGEAETSWLDRLGAGIGMGGGTLPTGGGGSSPLAGATFSRVDASFSSTMTVEINLPPGLAELGGAVMARTIADEVGAVFDDRNREAREHYTAAARSL